MLEHVEMPAQYRIGHERIDDQHSQLFVILMRIIKLIKNDDNKNEKKIEEEMNELLSSLRSYTQSHFQYEERHMEKIKYPEFETHKTLHKYFIDKIIEIQKSAVKAKKEKPVVLKEMAVFLKDWYLKHILNEDKKIILFEKDGQLQSNSDTKMKAQTPS